MAEDKPAIIVRIPGDVSFFPVTNFIDIKHWSVKLWASDLFRGIVLPYPGKVQQAILGLIAFAPHRGLICQVSSGWGKSTCFSACILSRLESTINLPQALCICPSRELAIHNLEVLSRMTQSPINMELAFTGCEPSTGQVIAGTPDSLHEWVLHKNLNVRNTKIIIFDEADILLGEGRNVEMCLRILTAVGNVNPECQVLLFFGCYNDKVKAFESEVFDHIFVGKYNKMVVKELPADCLTHFKICCKTEDSKIQVVRRVLGCADLVQRTVIFVRHYSSALKLQHAFPSAGIYLDSEGMGMGSSIVVIVGSTLNSRCLLNRGFGVDNKFNFLINYDLPVNLDFPLSMDICYLEPDYQVYTLQMCKIGRLRRTGGILNLLNSDQAVAHMDQIERHFESKLRVTDCGFWTDDLASRIRVVEALTRAKLRQ